MTSKLILNISEKAIENGKRISKKRGKSLSKIIEEYLNSINEKDEETAMEAIEKIMRKYRNKIPLPADGDYKKQVRDWQYEEYLQKKNKSK